MNITLIVILIIVFSLILGPVMMLRPRPAVRAREQMRLQARNMGLRFSMRQLPRLATDMDDPRVMPCYSLAPVDGKLVEATWCLMRTSYAHEGNFYQEWDWHGEGRPCARTLAVLTNLIASVPLSIKVLSLDNAGLNAYWSETEGAAFIADLLQMLEQIQSSQAVNTEQT